jgi:regulator of cell morphogenesis and NO signaling
MTTQEIDPGMSVNDAIREHPSTIAVFNQLGIDACCGGAASIDEAARRDGVDVAVLLAALRDAASRGAQVSR